MVQVVLILMDYLKSSVLIITMSASLFKQHPRSGFVIGWKKGKLVLKGGGGVHLVFRHVSQFF